MKEDPEVEPPAKKITPPPAPPVTAARALSDPRSFLFAASVPSDDTIMTPDYGGTTFGFGQYAPTVNSAGLAAEKTKPTLFQAHQWTHITMVWELKDPVHGLSAKGARLFINGREVGVVWPGKDLGNGNGKWSIWYHDPLKISTTTATVTEKIYPPPKPPKKFKPKVPKFGDPFDEPDDPEVDDPVPAGPIETVTTQTTKTTVSGKLANTIRLGNPSQIVKDPDAVLPAQGPMFNGNFPADATFDELFVWDATATGLTGSQALWSKGRYYSGGLNGDAWVSPVMTFPDIQLRQLPPPVSIDLPKGAQPTSTSVSVQIASAAPKLKIKGVSFTWYGEETVGSKVGSTTTMKRVLWDYNSDYEPVAAKHGKGMVEFDSNLPRPKNHLEVGVEVTILANDQAVTKCTNDGYSDVDYEFDPTVTKMRYAVRFVTIGGPAGSAVLLATPVFDDITVYVSQNQPTYLEYVCVR